MIVDQFREFRLTQARLLIESAELVEDERKELVFAHGRRMEKSCSGRLNIQHKEYSNARYFSS